MTKEVSTGIRAFVKDSLNQYYKRFLIKLDDNPSKNSQKSAIKIHNDGSIYVYDIGNYTGSVFDNASTLLEVIKAIGQGHGTRVEAGDNIQVDSTETVSTISALGYIYNLEKNSFAENSNIASGSYSHAEGGYTTASEYASHAEGFETIASGRVSHAEGYNTSAGGVYSHVEGFGTIANNEAEHASGKYNKSNNNTLFSVGIGTGTDPANRKNAFEITNDGSVYMYIGDEYESSYIPSGYLESIKNLQKKLTSATDNLFNSYNCCFKATDDFTDYTTIPVTDTIDNTEALFFIKFNKDFFNLLYWLYECTQNNSAYELINYIETHPNNWNNCLNEYLANYIEDSFKNVYQKNNDEWVLCNKTIKLVLMMGLHGTFKNDNQPETIFNINSMTKTFMYDDLDDFLDYVSLNKNIWILKKIKYMAAPLGPEPRIKYVWECLYANIMIDENEEIGPYKDHIVKLYNLNLLNPKCYSIIGLH